MNETGLYIHIPYCKRKCTYCNFHFSTQFSTKSHLILALIQEIQERAIDAEGKDVKTIYFGGGTPSVLGEEEMAQIFEAIHNSYIVSDNAEITLEANPDDLTNDYLHILKNQGINRLSIGIQSFVDEHLVWMNRSHDAMQSHQAIQDALSMGFTNLSCDLIYGIPMCTDDQWMDNLSLINAYQIPHLSAYALTVEDKTLLSQDIKRNKVAPLKDDHTIRQMDMLLDWVVPNQFEAYEISNFAKAGMRSKHNSSYWTGKHYLGFGPSAHSYDGQRRQWNIANNALYIQAIQNKLPYSEFENLSKKEKFNEYIMLQLRRIEGLDINVIQEEFPEYASKCLATLNVMAEEELLNNSGNRFTLTRSGKHKYAIICGRVNSYFYSAKYSCNILVSR